MSKKKNTLKDLDDFLRQQAAVLVAPTPLSETIRESAAEPKSPEPQQSKTDISIDTIFHDIKVLSEKEGSSFRKKFYELIIQSVEANKQSTAEDKMLINTALYLKSGDKWKEAIVAYWKGKH